LPPNLKKLTLPLDVTDEGTALLPQGLTSLDAAYNRGITKDGIALLPKTLKSFSLVCNLVM
jgi:hypothetical protein